MKLKLTIVAMACLAASAQGAISITFSNGTQGALSNFLNGAGSSSDINNVANRMVWGLLVDTDGDGFDSITSGNSYNGGFSLAANANGFALSLNTSVITDDVLYIGSALMASSSTAINTPVGEVPANQNRILSFTGFNYNAGLGVNAGDKIAIIWFDATSLGGTANNGMRYGIFDLPNVLFDGVNSVAVLPTDNGGSYTFAPAFAGPDSAKAMAYTLGPIPEPSAALLGALGALGLLRRRRN
jgi:MYXO-CTERM domain-containing protein